MNQQILESIRNDELNYETTINGIAKHIEVIAQQLFERVEIEAGYKIHCTLNITYQQFCEEWIKIEKKLPEAG